MNSRDSEEEREDNQWEALYMVPTERDRKIKWLWNSGAKQTLCSAGEDQTCEFYQTLQFETVLYRGL